MTLDEFVAVLHARAALLRDPALRERLALIAANRVSALVKRRVFQNGTAQDGSAIGQYSTKPGYFSVNNPGVPKIAPKSKVGRKGNKSFYSETGYAGYRKAVGRQSQKVDLNLSGATFQGVGVGTGLNGLPAFGIKTKEALQRIEGNEDRFDCVTVTPNQQERESAREDVREELRIILGISR